MLAEALEHLVRGIVEHPDDVTRPRQAAAPRVDPRGPGQPRGPRQGDRAQRPHGHRASAPWSARWPAGAAPGSTSSTSTGASDCRSTSVGPYGGAKPGVSDDYVVVGRIGRAHGVRGEVVGRAAHRRARRDASRRARCWPRTAGRTGRRSPWSAARDPPGTAAGPVRGDRRPDDRRGGPRDRAGRPGRRRTSGRRTRRSSTTTSWSGSRRDDRRRLPSASCVRIEHNAAQDLLVIADGRRRGAGAVRERARARGRRGRRPDRGRRPAGPAARRRHECASTSSRSSPTTCPLELSLPGKAQEQRPARRTRARPARLDPRPAPHRRRHALRRRRRHGDEARAVGRGARRGRRRGRDAGRAHPGRRAVHPAGGGRARDPGAPGVRLRPLRGHRPAGDRRGRDPDGGARALDRRLRAQRRRGRPRWRSSRPSSACCPGSWATPTRWPRSRTATGCWSTPSTPSRPPGAASTSPRCCSRATTPGSPPGAATSPYDAPRERRPDLLHPSQAVQVGDVAAEIRHGRRRPTPASCSPCSAPAGCRRRRPTTACTSRRSTRSSPTCRPGWASGRRSCCAAAAGSSARCAGRLGHGEDAWDIGRLMVAPDLQGAAWAGCAAGGTSRRRAAARRDRLRALHRGARSARNHADVPAGRLPRCAGRPQPGAPGAVAAGQAAR